MSFPYLNGCAEDDYEDLRHGPVLDVVGVVLDQVEVPGLAPAGHRLELPHDLDTERGQSI